MYYEKYNSNYLMSISSCSEIVFINSLAALSVMVMICCPQIESIEILKFNMISGKLLEMLIPF